MKDAAIYYDDSNPSSIESYAKQAIGKTFLNILEDYFRENPEELIEKINYYNNPRSKGSLGNLIEKYYFYYEPNSISEPDFPKAKVELKVTPYEKLNKKGGYKAGERLVIGMIPRDTAIEPTLSDSHLFDKINLILIILYQRIKGNERITHTIDYAKLFSILGCKEDLLIIEDDYKKIAEKIMDGRAHELSESDTLYLGACTKGATAEKSTRPQYYNSEIPAKRRAFCLKQGFMTHIINTYIFEDIDTYEPIIKNAEELIGTDFESLVTSKINSFIGRSEDSLASQFLIDDGPKKKKAKSAFSQLAFRMLGVKSNNAEEFVKGNVIVKTIRLEENNTIREDMSFPTFVIKEFIDEDWEDSLVREYFSQNKFLFMIFKNENGRYVFKGCQFWNMPTIDLEGIGYQEWKTAQDTFKNGIEFYFQGNKIANNLPNGSKSNIFFVRGHATKTAHLINGVKYGKGQNQLQTYADSLPNGDMMTNQCFWLTKKYVLSQLDTKFKS